MTFYFSLLVILWEHELLPFLYISILKESDHTLKLDMSSVSIFFFALINIVSIFLHI